MTCPPTITTYERNIQTNNTQTHDKTTSNLHFTPTNLYDLHLFMFIFTYENNINTEKHQKHEKNYIQPAFHPHPIYMIYIKYMTMYSSEKGCTPHWCYHEIAVYQVFVFVGR
jgi:hypothetical protein